MRAKTTNPLFMWGKYFLTLVFLLNPHFANGDKLSDEIKSYIENIKSISVEFTQSDNSDILAHGMLIIDKPYKFRCNYYEPFTLVIIGNKNYVSVYDYEMENLSRIKASENIFGFLLSDNIDFDNQFEILSAAARGPQYIVKLRHNDSSKMSEISFDIKSKQIQFMKIFEENNIITLTFGATQKIQDVSNSLFIMQDPDIFDKPKRLNHQQLEEKFRHVPG